jgi:hypothetical protein
VKCSSKIGTEQNKKRVRLQIHHRIKICTFTIEIKKNEIHCVPFIALAIRAFAGVLL